MGGRGLDEAARVMHVVFITSEPINIRNTVLNVHRQMRLKVTKSLKTGLDSWVQRSKLWFRFQFYHLMVTPNAKSSARHTQ